MKLCRMFGHAWEPTTVTTEADDAHRVVEYLQTLECSRCTTERVQRISVTGGLRGNRYRYVKGYLQPGGVVKEEIRVDYLREAVRR